MICYCYEITQHNITQHLHPRRVQDLLNSLPFWSGAMTATVKQESPRGQHGVPSVRLHWINTFFTHSTAGMPVPQSWLNAFWSYSLNTHACSAIDTSCTCTVNPFGEILALYCAHQQHLSALRLSALFISTHLVCEGFKCASLSFLHPLQTQQTSANSKHFSNSFPSAHIWREFLEITNITLPRDTLHIKCEHCVPAFFWT